MNFSAQSPFGEFRVHPTRQLRILPQKRMRAIFPLGIPGLRPSDVKTGDRGPYCDVQDTQLRLHGSGSARPRRDRAQSIDGSSIVLSDAGMPFTDSMATRRLESGVLHRQRMSADTVTMKHFGGRGGSPSATAGAAVGGGTATVWPGSTDASFVLARRRHGHIRTARKGWFARSTAAFQGNTGARCSDAQRRDPPVAGSLHLQSRRGSDRNFNDDHAARRHLPAVLLSSGDPWVTSPSSAVPTANATSSNQAATLSSRMTQIRAILRLLIQDTWIGDDGERAGDSLGAVAEHYETKDQVQRICEQRLESSCAAPILS